MLLIYKQFELNSIFHLQCMYCRNSWLRVFVGWTTHDPVKFVSVDILSLQQWGRLLSCAEWRWRWTYYARIRRAICVSEELIFLVIVVDEDEIGVIIVPDAIITADLQKFWVFGCTVYKPCGDVNSEKVKVSEAAQILRRRRGWSWRNELTHVSKRFRLLGKFTSLIQCAKYWFYKNNQIYIYCHEFFCDMTQFWIILHICSNRKIGRFQGDNNRR